MALILVQKGNVVKDIEERELAMWEDKGYKKIGDVKPERSKPKEYGKEPGNSPYGK